jgi:hypothetical protein
MREAAYWTIVKDWLTHVRNHPPAAVVSQLLGEWAAGCLLPLRSDTRWRGALVRRFMRTGQLGRGSDLGRFFGMALSPTSSR